MTKSSKKNKNMKYIHFRISESLLARWQRVNEIVGTNASEIVRRLIEEYVAKKEEELKVTTKVVEIITKHDDFPVDGEAYVVGKVDDGRYFFAWGPEYPFADEVPAHDVENGESGISFYGKKEDVLDEMMGALQAALTTMEPSRKRERIEKIFFELHGSSTDWSYAADLFVAWCISKDFQCESFDKFIEWMDDDRIDSVWDFWFGYGDDFEKFADDWVSEGERDDYLKYCREHA